MSTQNDPNGKLLDNGGFDFLGKELDPQARVWNVYRDEITADDKAHGFERWTQTLDVLLIFAGLFSAVVTAFLIDSYKLLQKPDNSDFVAAALYALVVATDNSALLRDLPKPSPLSSMPSSGERWVNALWFTSLIIALSVALLAILAKQWLQEFHRRLEDRDGPGCEPTPSNEWTSKRWFYVQGMNQKWPTDDFITYILPLMLHAAVFLFLAGLSLFLWSIDNIVSLVVLALSGALTTFYIGCTVLPLPWPDAPTATPLLNHALALTTAVLFVIMRMTIGILEFLESLDMHRRWSDIMPFASVRFPSSASPPTVDSEAARPSAEREPQAPASQSTPSSAAAAPSIVVPEPPTADPGGSSAEPECLASPSAPALAQYTRSLPLPVQSPIGSPRFIRLLRNRFEDTLIRLQRSRWRTGVNAYAFFEAADDGLAADILTWLIVSCKSKNAVMIGFQAVGALDIDSHVVPRLRGAMVGMTAMTQIGSNKTPSTLDAIRAIRADLVLGRGTWHSKRLVLIMPDSMRNALSDVTFSDVLLFESSLAGDLPEKIHVIQKLHSGPSTSQSARLLLRSRGRVPVHVVLSLLAILDFATLSQGDIAAIFTAFESWDHAIVCGCRPPGLRCIIPLLSRIQLHRPGGDPIMTSSLPPFVALRLTQYFMHKTGEAHQHVVFPGFLNHPGWLHPLVRRHIPTDKARFIAFLMGSTDRDDQALMAINAVVVLGNILDQNDFDPSAPLSKIYSYSSETFANVLSVLPPFFDFDPIQKETMREWIVTLRLALHYFTKVVNMHTSDKTYTCTESLLAISAGLCLLTRYPVEEDEEDEVDEERGAYQEALFLLQHVIDHCPGIEWTSAKGTHLAQHLRELADELHIQRLYRQRPAIHAALVKATEPCDREDCNLGRPPSRWPVIPPVSSPGNSPSPGVAAHPPPAARPLGPSSPIGALLHLASKTLNSDADSAPSRTSHVAAMLPRHELVSQDASDTDPTTGSAAIAHRARSPAPDVEPVGGVASVTGAGDDTSVSETRKTVHGSADDTSRTMDGTHTGADADADSHGLVELDDSEAASDAESTTDEGSSASSHRARGPILDPEPVVGVLRSDSVAAPEPVSASGAGDYSSVSETRKTVYGSADDTSRTMAMDGTHAGSTPAVPTVPQSEEIEPQPRPVDPLQSFPIIDEPE